jgi:two-component system invasion response regulator UvrY
MITILLVDDHELVRLGMSRLLGDLKDIKVIGEAGSGEEALELFVTLTPDVVLMDISMPGMGGLEATRKILQHTPKAKVLVISSHNDEPFPSRMLKVGALGYVTKSANLDEIEQAIRTVCIGKRYLSPEIAQTMALQHSTEKKDNPFDGLSERELQIMLMTTKGMKPNEIGDQLAVSPKTVNSYRYRLFEKLSIDSDVELTLLALKYHMLDLNEPK